ncbi:hypothetical protein J6590_005545 [Homalodisca vitripennis]|nr:hypothetical protein J6590_005545 [Homalodisca vitripennis]
MCVLESRGDRRTLKVLTTSGWSLARGTQVAPVCMRGLIEFPSWAETADLFKTAL